MAKLLKKTSIFIDGNEIKQFYQFSLSQGIFAHHFFKLVCPAETLDGANGSIFSNSKNFIGTSFTIKLEGYEKGETPFQFAGLVTQVESSRLNGHMGDVIVSGFSPTLLMDNGSHSNSWEKQALKNIAVDVCGHFPANLLSPRIQPSNNETFAYTVQYKETAWQFLNRLAATYGEWLYYDGKSLSLGAPKAKTADLIFGANLSQFTMALQARPASFSQLSYDFVNFKIHSTEPDEIAQRAGLDDKGKKLLEQSNNLFASTPKHFNNAFLTNEKQLQDNTDTRAAAQASNMIRFNGSSTHFGVQLGNTINVSDNYGSYTVIEVNHMLDGQGNYHNEFISIPQSIKVPPVTNFVEPICEAQSAIVTDNFDPKGLGRVRVRFHWMNPNKKSPWLRMMMPHAGGGKGAFFIPEIAEEVIVGFENSSPTKPYVQGAMYNKSQNTSFSNEGNDVKMIQTRSGTKMRMNDAEGSIFIEDPSGNTWLMDGKGNIKVSAPNNMSIDVGKNFDIRVGENMNTSVGANQTITIGNNKTENIAKNYLQFSDNKKITVSNDKTENVGNNYRQTAGESDIQTLRGDMKIRGTALTVIQGGKDVKVSKG
jgi:type VI secretion system secreted protein VgrG